jgi:hypothetical protein
MKRSEGSLRQKALKLESVSVINGKTGATFVIVATDSGLSSRFNLVILDGAHDFPVYPQHRTWAKFASESVWR